MKPDNLWPGDMVQFKGLVQSIRSIEYRYPEVHLTLSSGDIMVVNEDADVKVYNEDTSSTITTSIGRREFTGVQAVSPKSNRNRSAG